MENEVFSLVNSGIAVDLLVPGANDTVTQVGIRLRTYGKNLPAKRMVLAGGDTFEEALKDAIDKAEHGRWESLDWAARPWEVVKRVPIAERYGL